MFWVSIFVVLFFLGQPAKAATAAERPNIIVILVDDLGYSDLGDSTPNIDLLKAQGLSFNAAYSAAPVCSPTRAALLTGKHPARLHLTDFLPGDPKRNARHWFGPQIEQQLPLREVTIAEVLKQVGYKTAHIGKWHLGGAGFGPEKQGFDVNVAGTSAGMPKSHFGPFAGYPRLARGTTNDYLTDRLTVEATQFIRKNRRSPFFLQLAHYAVHIPLEAKADLVKKHEAQIAAKNARITNALYAAMIESVDQSVGAIMNTLRDLKIDTNTVVIFTSDNGGLSVIEGPNTPATSNAPLNGGKGMLYEGGIRVPLIVKWPGNISAAGTTSSVPVVTMDLFPTILDICHVNVQSLKSKPDVLDGLSLTAVLSGAGQLNRENLWWHYPHNSNQGGEPSAAIRSGQFKLIEFFDDQRTELFNLTSDPGERNNLAARMRDRVNELREKLHQLEKEAGAQPLRTNTTFSKIVPQRKDGTILLHARDAETHGSNIRFEPQPHKNTIGYWTRADDWVSWDFEVTNPGSYKVELLQGCGTGSGNSEVEFAVGEEQFSIKVLDTGGFQNFLAREIGTFKFPSVSRYTLAVKPRSKPGLAVMDLRQVKLTPATDPKNR